MFSKGEKKIILVSLFFVLLSACFGGGIDKRGSVKNYRDGVVITEGGSFRVGTLASDWIRKKFSYRAILFENQARQASISISSFCKRAADDASLPILANQLFYGVTKQRKISEKQMKLDRHDALWRTLEGEMDGAPVKADAVVLKMNECVFDFVHVSAPSDYAYGGADFKRMIEGFRYVSGPGID